MDEVLGTHKVGASFADVVKLAFFVLDVADLPAIRAARDAVIDTVRPPASTAVQVAALFAPGYLIGGRGLCPDRRLIALQAAFIAPLWVI